MDSAVCFAPLFQFPRFSIQRILSPLKFFLFLKKTKPDLVIINTYELLAVTILAKYLFGLKVIYDVRENYYRNVAYGKSFPQIIRWSLAIAVRFTELFYSLFVDFFFLAEAGYAQELRFVRNRFIVLENRVSKSAISKIPITRIDPGNKFLFSGTISMENGIFEAIDFVSKLRNAFPDASLRIAGYCANGRIWKKVLQKIAGLEYVTFIGGNEFVSHEIILQEIGQANYILMPYKNLPQIRNCFPTKIFEAVALSCPILISNGKTWNTFITNNNAGLLVDFKQDIPEEIIKRARSHQFYCSSTQEIIYWETQENPLMESIMKLI
jgi:glycosyltransferase involved in cell wall biosynthesis